MATFVKPVLGIFNIDGRIVFQKNEGCAVFYKLMNSSRKTYDCWLTLKNSMEREFMNINAFFNIDKDLFSDSIREIIKIRNFNKLKKFTIRLYRNNLYLKTISCKWDNDMGNLCSNCKAEAETRIHLSQTCSKT